jgi:hypothetical protein
MKARTFIWLGLLVSLTLVLTAAVAAKEPPDGGTSEEGPALSPSAPLGINSVEGVRAPAVPLGQPGLSFRYVQTFGVTEEAYPTDAQHLNTPYGLFIDDGDDLYVVEERGFRMLKFNATGANQLIVGHAGLPWHHDDYLSYPNDVTVKSSDGHIWVVMDHCIKEFDTGGTPVQRFPDADPWNTGADNEHFNGPRGIAFDSAGRLYVSDTENHRVQVYTSTVEGSLVYSTTIGETGVAGSDDTHFNRPTQIAFDSSNRLYVADTGNFRVQRCTYAAGWTCTTFHGGSEGSGDDELSSWACGIGIGDNDNVYIADNGNHRVKKCNSAGTCSAFAGGFIGASGVAADSSDNVYVSDWEDGTIRKYNSSGGALGTFAGVSGVPYVADNVRLNTPWGIAVASDGSIYVTENRGLRLVKLNAAGIQQWTIGQAGVYGDDNTHLGMWPGLGGNVAIDAAGRIYVSDTNNNRIQIFSSNGVYSATFGSGGNGNYEFECPTGVAISPANGDLYVTDHCNQRIQVFSSSRVYKATLGIRDETGTDNQHFNGPWGVGLDASGNIYVADADNHRVQKCTLSDSDYTCTTFAGETGVSGDDFSHLAHPLGVAVDGAGRVYVADEWNNRVQVFDSTGAYLTTIGGVWGTNTGQMIGPSGIALDRAGNVYVTDRDNHRIQKYAPGVPGWRQVNINGFGDRWGTGVTALEVFTGQLYAGTSNWDSGARVWRTSDGTTWTAVSEPGFGSAYTNTNAVAFDMIEFRGQLYAGTGNWWDDGVAGQVWRSSKGTAWTQVEDDGFGNANNVGIVTFAVFSDTLYAATYNATDGLEIWRSDTGDSGDWESVITSGFGGGADYRVSTGLTVFNGYLYAAVEASSASAAQMWRTNDGITWTPVNTDGFGDSDNDQTGGFAIFGGYLYVGTRNDATGAQLYRSLNGTTWEQVIGNGFGDNNNYKMESPFAFNGYLYAGTRNEVTGVEVWRSTNGTSWSQVNPDGFGDSNNGGTLWSVSTVAFNNRLYIGTAWNDANGGEVWQFVGYPVYLPLVVRNR